MVVLYLCELALKLFKGAGTFMLITLPEVDDSPGFWLPPDNSDGDSPVVFKSPIKFAHSCFALRE
jgi:hypothetical protein